jgi:ethanolamine utilization protein EutA
MGRINRIEAAGYRYAAEAGVQLHMGDELNATRRCILAELMADQIMAAARGDSPSANGVSLLRTAPLMLTVPAQRIILSGGVAEYFYGREQNTFGDLGPEIAAALRTRLVAEGYEIEHPDQAIRATVVGASQYTTQVSGSTIYISPMSLLPLRNVPVIAADLGIECESIDSSRVISAIRSARVRLDLTSAERPVAIFAPWRGSATFDRLDAFCRGIAEALKDITAQGHPIVLAGDGDVGGLIGAHFHHELNLDCPVVSIDSLDLREFDYIDIGEMLEYSGAVPVVIKSLIFPGGHS